MKQQHRLLSLFIAMLLGTLVSVTTCLAQSQPSSVVNVTHIRIKPEAIREFEALMKAEVLPAFKKSGGTNMQVWVTASFGEAYEYYLVRPVNGISDYDAPHYLVKALGEKGAEDLRIKIRRMSIGQDQFLLNRNAELSWMPNANYQYKLLVLTRTTVVNGRAADYEKYVKENTMPLLAKTNAKGYRASRVGLGGNFHVYYSSLLFDTYAEIDAYTALRDKARAAAGLSAPPAGLLNESISTVLRFLPELSVAPATQTATK